MKATRVLLVGGFPPPHGGISVHVQALREAAVARGALVRVLDVGSRTLKGPDVYPVPGAAALAARLAAHAATGWLAHVHVSGHTPKSWGVALAGALARRPFGPPPLLTVHSGLLPTFLAQGKANRALVRRVATAYARVVAVSPRIAEALAACGVPAARIAVAPAFTGRVAPGDAPEALAGMQRRFERVIACAVSPSPVYGLRVLLPALRLVSLRRPEVGLALFGPGPAQRYREAARAHGVEERVRALGELSHGEALAVLAECDLFVRPTVADGDSLSVREALALGRPVVASDAAPRPEGVRLFRSGDPVALARAIEAGLDAPAPQVAPEDGLDTILRLYADLSWVRAA